MIFLIVGLVVGFVIGAAIKKPIYVTCEQVGGQGDGNEFEYKFFEGDTGELHDPIGRCIQFSYEGRTLRIRFRVKPL